jgi:hypothetical protein
MADETKECINCDAVIGATETKCPKCGAELAEMEETVSAIEKAQAILDKRKVKAAAKKAEEDARNAPPAPKKKTAAERLRSLGKAFKKG